MKTNPSLMRAALALGAIAGMAGAVSPVEDRRQDPEWRKRRDEWRRQERERAAALAAPHIAKAEAKRRRKALKLSSIAQELSR